MSKSLQKVFFHGTIYKVSDLNHCEYTRKTTNNRSFKVVQVTSAYE